MKAARARLDAYSHHPYPVTRGETPSRFARGVCRYCTGVLSLAHLDQLIREVKRDFGPKRIWLTEYGYETNPPDPNGVSWALQSQYLAEAAQRAKNAAPSWTCSIHFMLRDEPRLAGWQSGCLRAPASSKPALNSFMLPIAQAARKGLRTTIWGQVRPGFGKRLYRLQRLAHGRYVSVGHPALTNIRGSYTRVVRATKGSRFRVLWLSTADQPADRVH